MKAILFAAGLGTRLGELTQSTPKALVRLNGEPLLFHALQKLRASGVDEVVVNVHHFSNQIINYLSHNSFGIAIHISDESNELADTGGGLLKARDWLDGNEPFLAVNVDVLTSLDLKKVIEFQHRFNPLATLVVRKRETNRYFLFDSSMQLVGWKNTSTREEQITRPERDPIDSWAFSGLQVISPSIFNLIEESGKFSLTPLYIRLSKNNTILGYGDSSDFWIDLGKPGQIEEAEQYLSKRKY